MKMAESENIVLVSCIIDFEDMQVLLRLFSLSLNACKIMMVFFKFWPGNIKKASISLAGINILNETCISSKSMMQHSKTHFSDSAIFIEKKTVEIRLWAKSEFSWAKKII